MNPQQQHLTCAVSFYFVYDAGYKLRYDNIGDFNNGDKCLSRKRIRSIGRLIRQGVTSVFNLEDLMQCAVTSRLPLPFAEARKKKHAKK
jgi:hypothetical protein